MSNIHPTANISSEAKIGENVIIGPNVYIEGNVEIGEGTNIGPNAGIYDGARIGKNVKIFQAASISNHPQDISYANEETFCFVGDNTILREFVTLHKGTKATGKTTLGSDCFLMAYSHVAHDCRVGDKVILVNAVNLGGHVHVDFHATIGGGTVVHQFCTVGKHTMIGGGFRITQDVPHFIMAADYPLDYKGLNVIGLRRRGFTNQQIESIKRTYTILYSKANNVSQAMEKIKEELPENEMALEILAFLEESRKNKRGIVGKV